MERFSKLFLERSFVAKLVCLLYYKGVSHESRQLSHVHLQATRGAVFSFLRIDDVSSPNRLATHTLLFG